MKRIVEKRINILNLKKLKNSEITELVFEDKQNWFVEYDRLAICCEYDRNNRFFADRSIGILDSGYKKFELTDDGVENMRRIRSIKSVLPDMKNEGVLYRNLVRLKD